MPLARRTWMAVAVVLTAGCIGGYSLGQFAIAGGGYPATGTDYAAQSAIKDVPTDVDEDYTPVGGGSDEPVRCKGCGPTLAERQMSSVYGGGDPELIRYQVASASDDRAEARRVDEYLRQIDAEEAAAGHREATPGRTAASRVGNFRDPGLGSPPPVVVRTTAAASSENVGKGVPD